MRASCVTDRFGDRFGASISSWRWRSGEFSFCREATPTNSGVLSYPLLERGRLHHAARPCLLSAFRCPNGRVSA